MKNMSIKFDENNNLVYPYFCKMKGLVKPSDPYHHPNVKANIEYLEDIREVRRIEHYKRKDCSKYNNSRIRKYYNRLSTKRVYIYKKMHISKNIDSYLSYIKKLNRERKLLEWM